MAIVPPLLNPLLVLFCPGWISAVDAADVDDEVDETEFVAGFPTVDVWTTVLVRPPSPVLVWVTVVRVFEVGEGEEVVGLADVVGAADVVGVLLGEEEEDVVGVGVDVGVCDVDEVKETGEEVEVTDGEEVDSVAEVVELEDMVNCLNLRSRGRLKPGSTYAE
jgi:hypothetical protein